MVEEVSTTAPSTQTEVPEPAGPLLDLPDKPAELPKEDLPDQPAELAKEDLPDQPVEPLASQDRAQDLVSSGKEVWAATVSERTVLFEHVENASLGWGSKQPDIVGKLINPQDADTVAAWSQNRALPRILPRKVEGQIWVSSQFLQAHCKKLALEKSPRSQRERSRSPRRPLAAVQTEPDDRAAEDAFTSRVYASLRAYDKARAARHAAEEPDKPAAPEEAEAAPAAQPAAEQEPDKRTRPELSDQDRAQVEPIIYSGEVVWAAAKESDRTVLFQQIRRSTSPGQPAPELSVKLINPERDEELVRVWCKAGGRFPKIHVSPFEGEFCLHPEFVHAYCWELSWDSVAGQRHAEDAKPADAKPAEAEDEAEPAPVADAKPAVAEDKPAEQADDNAEPAVEDAKPAEEGDAKPAEVEPAAEADAKPAEEAEDAKPDEPAAVAEDDVETLHGLLARKVEGDWYELTARSLDDYEVAEKILPARLKDKTFAEYKMKRGDKGWTHELFEVRWDIGKLWMPKGRRSVLPDEARVRVRLSA